MDSRRIAKRALNGVGKPESDREEEGNHGVIHVYRLLTLEERKRFDISEPRDIRGTEEESDIIRRVFEEAPYLKAYL